MKGEGERREGIYIRRRERGGKGGEGEESRLGV